MSLSVSQLRTAIHEVFEGAVRPADTPSPPEVTAPEPPMPDAAELAAMEPTDALHHAAGVWQAYGEAAGLTAPFWTRR